MKFDNCNFNFYYYLIKKLVSLNANFLFSDTISHSRSWVGFSKSFSFHNFYSFHRWLAYPLMVDSIIKFFPSSPVYWGSSDSFISSTFDPWITLPYWKVLENFISFHIMLQIFIPLEVFHHQYFWKHSIMRNNLMNDLSSIYFFPEHSFWL